jgi:hypothetical protein
MLDTLPGLIVERAIPSDVWGRSYGGKIFAYVVISLFHFFF